MFENALLSYLFLFKGVNRPFVFGLREGCFILPLSCYFFFVMKIAIAITAAATTPPITQ